MEITGIISFFNGAFGFIVPAGVADEDRSRHVYCHAAALRRSGIASLTAGQRVAFELRPARRPGMKDEAANIRVLLDDAA